MINKRIVGTFDNTPFEGVIIGADVISLNVQVFDPSPRLPVNDFSILIFHQNDPKVTYEIHDQIIHAGNDFLMGVDYSDQIRQAVYTNLSTGKQWTSDLRVNHSMQYIRRQIS